MCDQASWSTCFQNLKVRIENKFVQINSALFSFSLISSCTSLLPKGNCFTILIINTIKPLQQISRYSGQSFQKPAESRSIFHGTPFIKWTLLFRAHIIADTIFRNRVMICLEKYLTIAETLNFGKSEINMNKTSA